jgi:ubiquinone/menaquinone biosynthesis C-methylase UbiE
MPDATASIVEHYSSGDLFARIMRALTAAGHDTDHPTVEMFNLVDQLHGGGLNSTKAQAQWVGVGQTTRVLDAGCGIGGSSRYLAHSYGCRVDAIDLTPEYVSTAARLNTLCGLADKIVVREGSVTALPYTNASFDIVWCQNVSMNVEDKRAMFSEAFRVLKPGRRYTLSHAARGPAGDPYYPLPWARAPSFSFLGTPAEVLQTLRDAGFSKVESRTEAGAPGGARAPSDLGPSTVMGADMPERAANAARSGREGRLIGMLVVAERAA